MANSKVSALTNITSLAGDDKLYLVDTSNTTDGANGSSARTTIDSIGNYLDGRTETLTNKTIDGDNNTISNLAIGAEVTGASTDLTDTADITYNADTDVSANGWVVDEDNMASDLATKVPTQQSVKAYVDANSGGLGNVVEDTTPQLGGNLNVNGNSIVSTSAGNITITPDTTGEIVLDGLSWPQADGSADQVLKTDGAGQLGWTANTGSGIASVVDDTTPQLGGQLDVNGNPIGDGTRELLTFTEDASAVNHVNIENEATGSGPIISSAGDDTNIDLLLVAKGSGVVQADGAEVATISASQTLTNKTIDGDNNTISNLDIGNEVDWAAATDVSDASAFTTGDKVLVFEAGVGMRKVDYSDLPGAGGGLSNVVEDTTPQLGGQLDVNGNAIGDGTNELLTFTEDASAVNNVNIENEATGSGPIISAVGDDTNIDLNIASKGTGAVKVSNGNLDLGASTNLSVNGTAILADSAGTMTLSNIDAIDATTETTLEAAIDALSNLTTVGTVTSGNVDAVVSAASTTTAGKVEIATAAETTTGTDATRAVSPDGLAGSDFGIRYIQATVTDYTTDTATGDGQAYFHIPAGMDGMNLVEVHAEVITAGTTGTTDIQIHNVTDAVDMLSTKLTIDSAETGSDTAATAAVINTSNDDVAENDLLRVDVDAVSTTAAKGLIVTLGFQLP